MSLPNLIKIAVVVWCLCEAALFAAAVRIFGLAPVVLFQFAVGAVGIWLLKRMGGAALTKLRASLRGRNDGRRADIVDEGFVALGALALTLPGFLSDVLGAALINPMTRRPIARWLIGRWTRPTSPVGRASVDPAVIDLAPNEWRRMDGRRSFDPRT